MKRLSLVFTLLLILLIIIPLVAAQEDNLIIQSDSIDLDEAAIQDAAQPLLDRGAVVAIYFADHGDIQEAEARLQADNLMQGSTYEDNLIAIFVSLDRYYQIFYGDTWEATLRSRNEGIGSGTLAPNLREGENNEAAYTLAVTRTLAEIDAVIENRDTEGIQPFNPSGGSNGGNNGNNNGGGGFDPGIEPIPADPGTGTSGGGFEMMFCCCIPLALPFLLFSRLFGGGMMGRRGGMFGGGMMGGGGFGGGMMGGGNFGGGRSSTPRYKSGWGSGRLGGGGGRSGSFKGGGRSGGRW